jgi:hypothetical protein
VSPPAEERGATLLSGAAMFMSAAIMFALQPMVGKMLLPLVGGTPAGWVVAMAFFQIMLLAGYLLAHLLSRLPPLGHGAGYIAALLAGALLLPIAVPGGHALASATPGASDIFLLLTLCVAPPFIALSASSSTIQRLFAASGHRSAEDPYFLYAASNLGSFAGLLLYPALIEPRFTLAEQASAMRTSYFLLMALALACLLLARGAPAAGKAPRRKASETGTAAAPRATWLSLAFIPSGLLCAATTYILTDVISAPLIWVMPLALYLLTFVAAFARRRFAPLDVLDNIHPYAVFVAIFSISCLQAFWLQGWTGVLFYAAVFGFIALTCHTRLADLRPSDERRLTEYYLIIALGGALGGALNAFVIPHLFTRVLEFPLLLLASLVLHPDFKASSRAGKAALGAFALALRLANVHQPDLGIEQIRLRAALASGVAVAALFAPVRSPRLHPAPVMLAAAVLFMVSQYLVGDSTQILNSRNFYGAVAVAEGKGPEGYTLRSLLHGSTLHGLQVRDPARLETTPTTYFTREGPVGDVFRIFSPQKVAVIGLGSGSMSCHTSKGRSFTFFEINPAVADIAREQFTFLSRCAPDARILLGDGRLELDRLKGESFDMIVIDAFTSDAIPTNLMTREAFAAYLAHLKPKGLVFINISNRFFNLWNTLSVTAATQGLDAKIGADLAADRPSYSRRSLWMVFARHGTSLSALKKPRWQDVRPRPNQRPWTDDYTNLLGTLSIFGTGLR